MVIERAAAGRAKYVGRAGCSGTSEKSRFHEGTCTRGGGLSADAELRCNVIGEVARMRRDCGEQSRINQTGTTFRHAETVKPQQRIVKLRQNDCKVNCKLAVQIDGVMAQMVFDEALDEPVAVVVAGLHAEFDRLSGGAAGIDEKFGSQLSAQKLVGAALVDQDRAVEAPPRAHQFESIVGLPR